jgi:hypothetical protein
VVIVFVLISRQLQSHWAQTDRVEPGALRMVDGHAQERLSGRALCLPRYLRGQDVSPVAQKHNLWPQQLS